MQGYLNDKNGFQNFYSKKIKNIIIVTVDWFVIFKIIYKNVNKTI